jgi:hypothetical protein
VALSLADVRQAILRGLARSGWVAQEREPGETVLYARYTKGSHFAVVKIDYSEDQLSLSYFDSGNLYCKPRGDTCEKIHKAYNVWVQKLHGNISEALYEARQPPLYPSEAMAIIRQVIEEQPRPFDVTSVDVTNERIHVVKHVVKSKKFLMVQGVTTVPTSSTVYFNNIGQVEISSNGGLYVVTVQDKRQSSRLRVYSSDETSARRFVDALMVMSEVRSRL